MSTKILEKIKTRGYWHIVIRPQKFQKEHVPSLPDLVKLIEENKVSHRGWDYPHLTSHEMRRGLDYIQMATTFREINETWRFYQSGQFAFLRGLTEDWIKEDKWQAQGIEPQNKLSILSVLYQLSEMYEFAARLAQAGVFDNILVLKVNLVSTQGRELFFWPGSGMRWLGRTYTCDIPNLPKQESYIVTDFIARSRDYSFQHFQWIMGRFGFDISSDVFKRDQEKFFEGRF